MSLRRSLLGVLVILFLAPLAAHAQLVVGGNPPHAILSQGDDEFFDDPDLAIASDGTLFVAFERDSDPDVGDSEIVVLRSTDGGDTRSTWSTLSASVGAILTSPRIGVVGDGTPDERVVVTYLRFGSPELPRLYAAFADPDLGVGVWTEHEVFDVRGRLVRTLVDGERPAGPHAVLWDATDATGADVASGVYRARITVGDGESRVESVAIVR